MLNFVFRNSQLYHVSEAVSASVIICKMEKESTLWPSDLY
jgi:hypothetical protein